MAAISDQLQPFKLSLVKGSIGDGKDKVPRY
jgi:hypothetical protein